MLRYVCKGEVRIFVILAMTLKLFRKIIALIGCWLFISPSSQSNTEKGSLANITERFYEILSYSDVFYLMIDTYIQLILWRGEIQFELSNQHWLFRSVRFLWQ